MKKRTRVIQISGFRGILMMVFIGACLAAGFVAFPAICAMHIWNYAANYFAMPFINVYQGLMLWAIIAISGFIINDKKKFIVEFNAQEQLSDKDMKKLLERVKLQSQAQSLNSMILKSGEVKSFRDLKQLDKMDNVNKIDDKKEDEKTDKENV